MASFLEKYFLIKRGEIKRVFLSILLLFFLASSLIIMRSAVNALYLSQPDISGLPLLFIAVAAAMTFASMLYSRIADTYPKNRTMYVLYTLYSALLIGLYFLSKLGYSWFYPFLYVAGSVIVSLAIMKGWTFIAEVFDSREAKRAFAFIGMGGTAAGILAGFGIKAYTMYLPTDSLLIVCAVFLFLSVFVTHALKKAGNYTFTPSEASKKKGGFGVGTILRKRYLLLIAVLAALGALGTNFGDYIFKVTAKEAYTGDELAGFFGLFFGISNIITLVYGLLFSTRTLAFLGIRNSLAVLPVELGLSTLVYGFIPTVFWASAMKFGITGIRYTVYNTAEQVMFLPLKKEVRGRLKTYIDGVVKPVSLGAAGLLLMLFSKLYGVENLLPYTIALGVMSFLWFVFTLPVKKSYARELYNSLDIKGMDLEDITEAINDPATLSVLEKELDSGQPGRVIYVLELLKALNLDMKKYYLKALELDIPQITESILPEIEKLKDKTLFDTLISKSEKIPGLKGKFFRTAAASDPDKASALTEKYIEDPDSREDAVYSMIQYMPLEQKNKGREICREWSENDGYEDRLSAARVISQAGFSVCRLTAQRMLEDESPEIRNLVLKSIERTPEEEWAEIVVAHLFNPQTRQTCINLSGLFPSIGSRLPVLYRNKKLYTEKTVIIDTIHKIGGENNIEFLLSILPKSDAGLKFRIVHALSDLYAKTDTPAPEREILLAFISAELKPLMTCKAFLSLESDITGLLETAYQSRLEMMFNVLGMIFGKEELHAAYLSVNRDDNKANAVELLDSKLTWKDKKQFLTILEETPENLAKNYKQFRHEDIPSLWKYLMKSDDRILKAAGIFTACLEPDNNDLSPCEHVIDSEDELIIESAVIALARKKGKKASIELFGSERAEPILSKGINMLSTIERLLFLKGADIFKELSAEYLLHLAKASAELQFLKGDIICEDGDTDRSMYIVVDGTVSIEKNNKQVALLEKGACIGEMALLDGEPRSATAKAETETNCLKIEYSDFYDVMSENVAIAKGVFKVLTARLRSMLSAEQNI